MTVDRLHRQQMLGGLKNKPRPQRHSFMAFTPGHLHREQHATNGGRLVGVSVSSTRVAARKKSIQMSASELTRRLSRRYRRSSDIATTSETQSLLESVQYTSQVNDDAAVLHDLLTRLGSSRDSLQSRKQIASVIKHCMDAARNARDRFLYIVLQCRDNIRLQNQAGQQLGIFGLCLTYFLRELQKGQLLVSMFPVDDAGLSVYSLQRDIDEFGEVLEVIEKHVNYFRPCSETETPELVRSKSDREAASSGNRHGIWHRNGTGDLGFPVISTHRRDDLENGSCHQNICSQMRCIPKKLA